MIAPHHVIRNLLRNRGYEVVRVFSDSRAESLLALHTVKLFKRLRINCVIDVGAHIGLYGSWLRNNAYDGFIVSFEPVTSNFRLLKQRCQNDSKWTAHALALGSRDEEREINVTSAGNFSSFFSPTDKSRTEFGWSIIHSVERVRSSQAARWPILST